MAFLQPNRETDPAMMHAKIRVLFDLCVSVLICVYLCLSLSSATTTLATAIVASTNEQQNTDTHRYPQISTDDFLQPINCPQLSLPPFTTAAMVEVREQNIRPGIGICDTAQREGPFT
jgi:hypothetical protein